MKRPPEPSRTLEKPRQPGRIRAIILAVMVHAAFFALIVFGVTWQSRPEAPVQAELWDKLPPAKVARTPEPKVDAKPPEPEPKPEPPKPEPPKPQPKPPDVKPEPPKPDPAIAQKLEREKREKEKKDKLDREKRDKQKEEEKKKREDEQRRKDEERAKREAEKAREEAAAAKQGEVNQWIDKIKRQILSRANVPDTVVGHPEMRVRIRILPGGEVLDITVTKGSGNSTYDSAIERGIRSASPLPVPAANSELFPQFRELNLNFTHER